MTAEEKENLLRFRHYIQKTLNPVYILSYMKDWLPDDMVEKIQGLKDNPTTAAEIFLQSIVELTSDGWFRGFLNALSAAGYTGLHHAIENWNFEMIENLAPHRALLNVIEPSLRVVDPEQVFPHMTDLKQMYLLYHANNSEITFFILCADNDNGRDVEMMDEDENSHVIDINVQYSEEPESDNLSASPCSPSKSIYVPKEARNYQKELAQPALNGKHTIICAPTGSGKTFVSVMICDHHLQKMPPGMKGKVVFLATKVPVYEQQKKVFQEYFKRSGYKVSGICGDTVANSPVEMIVEGNDIIVMTPQILVNCLNDGTLASLSLFTLMIFDECHNTIGNHPYHILMSKYLDLKFDQPTTPLPQIVGLTASLGVGSAKNLNETIKYICEICASLNAEVISTVKENIQELEEIVYKPQKSIRLVQKRPQNCFVDIILQMMSETEELARKVYAIGKNIELVCLLNHIICIIFLSRKPLLSKAFVAGITGLLCVFHAALKNWIEESPQLQHLNPEVLMGRGKRNQKTGMTLPNQKGVLDSFKTTGDSKILIATSVADEGIDIAQCNLVLLYEYTGNVIKMIQVRGRGRAKYSKCILVTSKKEQEENERYNMMKEELMNKAIKEVQDWKEEVFAQKIRELQKTEKQLQDSKKKEPQRRLLSGNRRLLCSKCKIFACDTDDIRVIEESHHTVIDENFIKRYITKPHEKPSCYGNFEKRCKLHCAKCQHDWGITVKYKAFDDLPIIKIDSFSVEDVSTGRQHYFRKWKNANFAMKEFDIEEMYNLVVE
uniref:RNA sensor RIG-I n=1 Tax=Anolis carolinensis TaxID=28377 RepID=H9G577_ANOCA